MTSMTVVRGVVTYSDVLNQHGTARSNLCRPDVTHVIKPSDSLEQSALGYSILEYTWVTRS